MINIEFVGEKPIINTSGISFDMRKHDKYQFIEPAAHILELVLKLNDQDPAKRVSPTHVLTNEQILEILAQARSDYEQVCTAEITKEQKLLEEELNAIKTQYNLESQEKQTLLKNHEYMYKYRLQRITNKVVYELIIETCVELIQSKNIKELRTPFSSNFLHVLGSIKSTLEIQRGPKANIEVELNDENPHAKLSI